VVLFQSRITRAMRYGESSTRMMSTLATAAFVLLLSREALGVENAKEKTVVNVELYYEALCGDSVRFVKNQLMPSYSNLKDHLKVTFVPYGKATHRRDEETGRWTFMCQHGPAECSGNRAQACALDAIEKNEKAEDRQRLSVELVGCVMSATSPSTAVTRCGQTVGLTMVTRRRIADCEESTSGDELLAGHGDKTYALEPPLTFVPTIVLNGAYSSKNQSAALSNFQRLICGLIPQDEKPASCASA